jgi:hypothetical protein
MLKKGIERVKPWQRGPKAPRAKPSPTPKHHEPMYSGAPPYPLPHMQIPYGYPVASSYQPYSFPPQYQYLPPNPPQQHAKEHHKGDYHKGDDSHDSGTRQGKAGPEQGHQPPHPPPPPPPSFGFIKRFFKYIFDSLKKRPVVYAFLLTNAAFFAHRELNPERHERHMIDIIDALTRSSVSWDGNGNAEKMKVTKFNDSLQNYSNTFSKASSGASVASIFEPLQTPSLLQRMKELEVSLTEEKRQEIARLTEEFQRESAGVCASLGAAAGQLRHCQLSGIAAGVGGGAGGGTGTETATAAETARLEQTNRALLAK